MKADYYSNGKLLLTAEYGVLDGALALAVPTKYGQSLEIESSDFGTLEWKSLDEKDGIWFEASFDLKSLQLNSCSDKAIAKTLEQLLNSIKRLNPEFNNQTKGFKVISKMAFPRNWGLGSSSTLVNNLAQWANVNPYKLLNLSFGGSGYDIACAQHNSPILYQLKEGKPFIEATSFNPSFKEQLYFVHLNKKQNSRKAIANYRKQDFDTNVLVENLSSLTMQILQAKTIGEFETLLQYHETVLSKVLKTKPIKELFFSDHSGLIKSLGGWGGDFVLATGNEKTPSYFKAKGLDVVIPYTDMVL